MRIRIAILIAAMLATACSNNNDSAPPQALLQAQSANSPQVGNAPQPENSRQSSLPSDVALPPAPPVRPPSTQPGSLDDPVATYGANSITYRELMPILLSANGFNAMLWVFERDQARIEAQRQNIAVISADISNELTLTMDRLKKSTTEMEQNGRPTTHPDEDVMNLTPEQMDQLLDKTLEQQHVSRAEFDVYIETNAILRKIAEPSVQAQMTDAALHAEFNVEYGEKALIECIVVRDKIDQEKAETAVRNGESFESVARRMSIDRASAELDGKLEPFTLLDNRYPSAFKQLAFSLEPEKIAAINIPQEVHGMQDGTWIIKLIKKIPPQHAKYEDYKDSVKEDLHRDMMAATLQAQQKQLQQMAVQMLKVQDPILLKAWEAKVNPPVAHDPNEIRREMDSQHAPATMPARSASATMPATAPAAP